MRSLVAFLGLFASVAFSSTGVEQVPLSVTKSTSSITADCAGKDISFDPRAYAAKYRHTVTCKAVNRADAQNPVEKDISLEYVYLPNPNATKTLLFVHGWPAIWSTWRNQITHFQDSYSLLIPTLRGFGGSTHPGDPQTSGTLPDMVSDLECIMNDANVVANDENNVACIGHDWGAEVCWEAARGRPDLVHAVVGAVVPYIPSAGPFVPTEALVRMLPHLGYQVYFASNSKAATNELDASIQRTLRAIYRPASQAPPTSFLTSETDFLQAFRNVTELCSVPFFSHGEEMYLVEEFQKQGFRNTLEFYSNENRKAYYDFVQSQGNYTIPQPALFIAPTADPVANWLEAATILKSNSFIPQLKTATIYTAHWPQLEKPDEFNGILERWLDETNF